MAKKIQTNTLPRLGDSTVTVASDAVPPVDAMITVPLGEIVAGVYAPRRLDVHLTGAQAETLKRVATALNVDSARAVAWMIDRLGEPQQ